MIRIQGFTKVYGDFVAVDDLSLHVEEGDIFGFIGPNGAGKSTTIRFLATLLKPTLGEAWVNGFRVTRQAQDVKRSIGFMPDMFGVYDGMRVWEFLDFFATAYEIGRQNRKRVIDDVLELLDLTRKRDAYVAGLSRGMKQRLCLAKTLVHDPPVLILDEPASGLDPRARLEMKALLNELRRMGKTILISSHILSELSDTCTKIGIIERGRLLAAGPIQTIQRQIQQHRVFKLRVLGDVERARHVVGSSPATKSFETIDHEVTLEFAGDDQRIAELVEQLVQADVKVLSFAEQELSLEEVFMKVTKGVVS
jgi:ABC-2 type transport system ATP-binding protein